MRCEHYKLTKVRIILRNAYDLHVYTFECKIFSVLIKKSFKSSKYLRLVNYLFVDNVFNLILKRMLIFSEFNIKKKLLLLLFFFN